MAAALRAAESLSESESEEPLLCHGWVPTPRTSFLRWEMRGKGTGEGASPCSRSGILNGGNVRALLRVETLRLEDEVSIGELRVTVAVDIGELCTV